jgi:hypothetical protein
VIDLGTVLYLGGRKLFSIEFAGIESRLRWRHNGVIYVIVYGEFQQFSTIVVPAGKEQFQLASIGDLLAGRRGARTTGSGAIQDRLLAG